jgi:hypothetical protein
MILIHAANASTAFPSWLWLWSSQNQSSQFNGGTPCRSLVAAARLRCDTYLRPDGISLARVGTATASQIMTFERTGSLIFPQTPPGPPCPEVVYSLPM